MAIVEFQDVSRVYTSGDHELRALDHVNMTLEEGKFVVILGPSGAGKSTLLNLLGGLDSPTEGKILVEGKDISTLTSNQLAEYRAATVENGYCPKGQEITVKVRGGDLIVRYTDDAVTLTGDTKRIFTGEIQY